MSLSDLDRISSPLIEVLRGGKASIWAKRAYTSHILQGWAVSNTFFSLSIRKEEYLKTDGEAQDTRTGEIS